MPAELSDYKQEDEMIMKNNSIITIPLLALSLLVTGCGTSTASSTVTSSTTVKTTTTSKKPMTIKVAYVPATLFAPLFVAIDKGYFKKSGLKVELKTVVAGQDANIFVANGKLDAAAVGFSAGLFNDIAKGLAISVVAPMGVIPTHQDPSPLVVAKGSHITSMQQLKGKTIAIAGGLGSTGSYMLATALKDAHMKMSDVKIANMSFPAMVTALEKKAITGAVLPAPFSTAVLAKHAAHILTNVGANQDLTGILMGNQFIKNHPHASAAFIRDLLLAARDLQGKQYYSKSNLAIFHHYTHLPIKTLKAMPPFNFPANDTIHTSIFTSMQKLFLHEHLLTYKTLLPASKIVNTTLAKDAVHTLGHVA